MPHCRNCGSKVSNDDEFCRSCGKPLETTPSPNDASKSRWDEGQIIKLAAGVITIFSLAMPWTNFTILETVRTVTIWEMVPVLQQLEIFSRSLGWSTSYGDLIRVTNFVGGLIVIGGIVTMKYPVGAVITIFALIIFGGMVAGFNATSSSVIGYEIGYNIGYNIAWSGAIVGLVGPYVVSRI